MGKVMPVTAARSATHGRVAAAVRDSGVAAHSARSGPGTIGPSQTTLASVNIVTSSAIEFIHNSGDWAWRHTRPAPGG